MKTACVHIIGMLLAAHPAVAWAQSDLEGLEEQAIKRAAARVAPAVVAIDTVGGLERAEGVLVGTGPTTGLVIAPDGHIISSSFNFIQQPTSILVSLPGREDRLPARIVATDHARLLTLLKVDVATPLFVPQAVSRQELRVGQWAIAVGRTFDRQQVNVSVGIVSATDRVWGRAVQTDAKISPSNYGGPLVDVYGRVMGVLSPLSPHAESEVAGVQWYDSGIGFAVPLSDVLAQLKRLRSGEDLYPGKMGITLKSTDQIGTELEIGVCRPNSPAYEAGLRAGDVVQELNGRLLKRQTHLRHTLGPLYAGDDVSVVALRGQQRIEVTLQLVQKLEPYAHPFLGILPLRDREPPVVRYVFDKSPAAEAGIQPGDRIVQLGSEKTNSVADLRNAMSALSPDDQVRITILRDEQPLDVPVKLGAYNGIVPSQLPPATDPNPVAAVAGGKIEVKLPEEADTCFAVLPQQYDDSVPHSLLVVFHIPGQYDETQLTETWGHLADLHQMIVLAPKCRDPRRWMPTDVEFVKKTIQQVKQSYNVDAARIATHGEKAGGAMAFLVGLSQRQLVRGISVRETGVPLQARRLTNEPDQPLSIRIQSTATEAGTPLAEAIQRLREARFPISISAADDGLAGLARWVDTLDRI